MNLQNISFESLSSLRYQFKLYEAAGERNRRFRALVVAFSGTHGKGSEGNGDSLFMESILRAALNAWLVDALVRDLRDLSYVWGNSIAKVLLTGKTLLGENFPVAVVTSDLCRDALMSVMPFVARDKEADHQDRWLFDELEEAIGYVERLGNSSAPPVPRGARKWSLKQLFK